MGLFKDFYDAWANNWSMHEQQEYNRQVERGQQDLLRRQTEALEKLAQNIKEKKNK